MPLSREQRRKALWTPVAALDERLAALASTLSTSTDPDATKAALVEKSNLELERTALVTASDVLAAEIAEHEREEIERKRTKWENELRPQALAEMSERADLVACRLEAVSEAYSDLVACEERHKTAWIECGRPGEAPFKSVAKRSLCDMLGVEVTRGLSLAHAQGGRAKRFYAALHRSALQVTRDLH